MNSQRRQVGPRPFSMLVAAAVLVAGCGGTPPPGGPGTAADPQVSPLAGERTVAVPVLRNVTLEPDRASWKVVGPAGSTIEATDADGATYRLDIPPGALLEDVEILAVPVATIAGLPAEAEVGGAIHFEPEGLVFRKAATLTITSTTTDRARLAFAYSGDLRSPYRYPVTTTGGSVTLEIVHFSGYGLLAGTSTAITAAELGLELPWEPPDGPTDQALNEIATVIDDQANPNRAQVINDALRRWIDEAIGPQVSAFRAMPAWNDGEFSDASRRIWAEFKLWDYVVKLVSLSSVSIQPALLNRIRAIGVFAGAHGVGVSNTDCIASPAGELALLRVPHIGHWLQWGIDYGYSGFHENLDPAFVAANLCVDVRFLPEDGIAFPDGLQPGQTGTLTLAVGLQIPGIAEVHGAGWYEVSVTPSGTDPGGTAIGTTDLGGRWSRDFTWSAAAEALRLDIKACLPAPLGAVCEVDNVIRGVPSLAVTIEIGDEVGGEACESIGNANPECKSIVGDGTRQWGKTVNVQRASVTNSYLIGPPGGSVTSLEATAKASAGLRGGPGEADAALDFFAVVEVKGPAVPFSLVVDITTFDVGVSNTDCGIRFEGQGLEYQHECDGAVQYHHTLPGSLPPGRYELAFDGSAEALTRRDGPNESIGEVVIVVRLVFGDGALASPAT